MEKWFSLEIHGLRTKAEKTGTLVNSPYSAETPCLLRIKLPGSNSCVRPGFPAKSAFEEHQFKKVRRNGIYNDYKNDRKNLPGMSDRKPKHFRKGA